MNTHWTTYGFYGLDFINRIDGVGRGRAQRRPPAYGLVHWNGADWIPNQPPAFQPTMYDVDMVALNAVSGLSAPAATSSSGTARPGAAHQPRGPHLYAMSMVSATPMAGRWEAAGA